MGREYHSRYDNWGLIVFRLIMFICLVCFLPIAMMMAAVGLIIGIICFIPYVLTRNDRWMAIPQLMSRLSQKIIKTLSAKIF